MPTVCLEKSTPKNNIARKEYNKLIGELNNEIDRLSTQNKSLIEKLAITEDQITVGRRNERDLENHNKALVEELCQLSKVNLTLKDERRHEIDLIEEETKRLRIQLDDAVRLKMEAEKEIQKLNMERENLERNLSDAQKKCHTMDTSERDMRNLILRAEEDKKRLAQRIEKLTANERALVLELERLKRHGGTSDGRTKRISQLDEFISGIEADRDYWRGQVEILQQMLNYPSLTSGTEGSGIGRTTTSSRLKSKPPTGQHTTTPSKLGGSLKDAKQRKLEQQVQELRVERDLLRQELDSITRSRHRSPSPVTRSRSLNRFQTRDDYMELTKLRQERDELRSLLNKLEHRVQEIQRNVHTLTQERDQINKLYNDSRSEIHRLHQDLYAMHETGDRNTQTTQTVLRRVESERDRALVDLSRVTAERDSLITKYKATVELANKDKVHLESCIEEMSSAHRQSLREREDLVQRSNGLHERNIELDAENKKLDLEVKRNAEALRAERNTIADLQQQLELCRRRSETAERDANDWSSRVRLAEDQLHKSETRVVQLERELRVERDDYSQLRSRMEMLEEEKQNLEINLKETSQRLSHTEVDLSSRLREIHDIRSAHEEALRTNTRTQEALSTRNNELTAARTELNSIQTSLSETRRLLESEQRETSRLREDLNHMARESQTLQTELQDVGDERDELKQRMKDYLNELSRLERVLSERDSECSKLMDQLRTANEESESWRTRWETAENKLTSCKVDLEDKEGELSNERERSDLKDREISHLRATLNSTEIQNNATSRSLVEANEQLRMSRAEIETLSTEISRIRDALSRSETEKANVQRENNTQRLDNDQLRAQLDDFEVELEQIKEQLEDERENNRNINEILTITRQKEQKALSEAQERTTEVIALRDRITSAEERAEMAQREVEKVRERLAETEREANRLSRSLSAERFEKERALSELRLSSLPAGYRPSGYSSLGATYYPGTSVSRDRTAYQERDDY
ncbi:unnamed protein product [Schistosoma margrebowiei]|uniref:Myosin_tail_1 domain-containing protein n=1 Tax=Schistosoma margrebowiei TaxID=48269 RepID=A0AA84ZYJ3_9TREM|nr:unnamed protein product [Schistosoma margrebowiei]